jgi:amino acid transporter
VVGCFDVYQSMFNALYSAVAIGGALTMVYGTERRWLPVYWVTVLASYLILHIIGGVWMWRLLKFMTSFSILMIFIYIFGSIQFADFEENAPLWFPFGLEGKFQYFHGGVDLFLDILPFTCWMFAGTESVNLAAHDCDNPKRDVPRGYILTWITIFCTSIGCVFIGASVFPGATLIAYYFFPTSVAYAQIFNISIVRATALSIPAIYTTGFGFTYYYGSQVRAMGKSGLANPWLGYDVPGFKTPIVALVFGFVVCMLVGLRYYWWKELKGESLLGISLMGASVVYCTQFISYIVLRLYYPTIKREFESPLGLIGAVYGLCVFLLVFIILACLESQLAIKAFSIYLGVILLYYFLVVRRRQVFSEEEKTVLFKAYLLKSKSGAVYVVISERIVIYSALSCVLQATGTRRRDSAPAPRVQATAAPPLARSKMRARPPSPPRAISPPRAARPYRLRWAPVRRATAATTIAAARTAGRSASAAAGAPTATGTLLAVRAEK